MAAALVGGAFLSASLQVLFDRLASRELLDFFRTKQLDNTLVNKLKWTLLELNAVLNDAEYKQITDSAVKDWMDELKDAVYHADDLLDQIATMARRCKLLGQEWMYILNGRSQINISYSVTSSISTSLILIVAQGSESFAEWIVDPSYPNGTLTWNDIHGSGFVEQDISRSSTYYVAVGNLNSEEVEVYLNLRVKASLYNTTKAYYKCVVARSSCSLKLNFPSGNAAVLTSPDLEQGSSDDYWYVQLSYGSRWITYVVGIAGMTLLMLLASHFLNIYHCSHLNRTAQYREVGSERAALLSRKDSDLSSWDSSYDLMPIMI